LPHGVWVIVQRPDPPQRGGVAVRADLRDLGCHRLDLRWVAGGAAPSGRPDACRIAANSSSALRRRGDGSEAINCSHCCGDNRTRTSMRRISRVSGKGWMTAASRTPGGRSWRNRQPGWPRMAVSFGRSAGGRCAAGSHVCPECQLSQSAQPVTGGGLAGGDPEGLFGVQRWLDQIVADDQRPVADVFEQVAAQQGSGALFEHHLGFPAVRHVRGIDLADQPVQQLATDVEQLAVSRGPSLAPANR
jgi:hypothetical protein